MDQQENEALGRDGAGMTKAEQIKQMTESEMASEINNLLSEMCRRFCKGCKESGYRCDEAVKKYLRTEVKEWVGYVKGANI